MAVADSPAQQMEQAHLFLVGEIPFRLPQMCGIYGSREKAEGYVLGITRHRNRTTNPQHYVVMVRISDARQQSS